MVIAGIIKVIAGNNQNCQGFFNCISLGGETNAGNGDSGSGHNGNGGNGNDNGNEGNGNDNASMVKNNSNISTAREGIISNTNVCKNGFVCGIYDTIGFSLLE